MFHIHNSPALNDAIEFPLPHPFCSPHANRKVGLSGLVKVASGHSFGAARFTRTPLNRKSRTGLITSSGGRGVAATPHAFLAPGVMPTGFFINARAEQIATVIRREPADPYRKRFYWTLERCLDDPSFSTIRIKSAREFARIFCMMWAR